jgi:hypothetical protein
MGDQKFIISSSEVSRWSRLHFQSVGPTNPHWTRVESYGPFSLCVIHKEGMGPSSGDINRLMMNSDNKSRRADEANKISICLRLYIFAWLDTCPIISMDILKKRRFIYCQKCYSFHTKRALFAFAGRVFLTQTLLQ